MAKIMKKRRTLVEIVDKEKRKNTAKNKTFGISIFGILQYKLQFFTGGMR